MVDFSKLRDRMPEDRVRDDRSAVAAGYAKDDAERSQRSVRALTMTLVQEPEFRSLPSGDRVMLMRGNEADRAGIVHSVYTLPPRINDDESEKARFDDVARRLGGGDQVTLAGQWAKRGWDGADGVRRESWEFRTQHFARGELPLDTVVDISRKSPGGELEAEGDTLSAGMRTAHAARAAAMAGRAI